MLRWAQRVALLLLFLWIARAHGDVLPVFLGYVLWAYLVWRAWPGIRQDFARLWWAYSPARKDLRAFRELTSRSSRSGDL